MGVVKGYGYGIWVFLRDKGMVYGWIRVWYMGVIKG